MLLTVVAAPTARIEVAVGTIAVGGVLFAGSISREAARNEVASLLPVAAFLVAVLVLAEAAALHGLFDGLGDLLGRLAGGSSSRMLTLTFGAAAGTTAVLSLDATVVLLTPVVTAAAIRQGLDPRPHEVACARLANSASLLFPVSNLTNLLAFSATGLTFVGFMAAMAPVWLIAIAVEYATIRSWFAHRLRWRGHEQHSAPVEVPTLPVLVIGVTMAAFAALSLLGVEPAWVAAVGAITLAVPTLRHRGSARVLLRAAHLPFAYFVLCWAIVVAAVNETIVGELARRAVPDHDGLAALLVISLLAMFAANLLNNLPATLLLLPIITGLGTVPLLAMLVGVNVGSNATYVGSLANLLWRRTMLRRSLLPSTRDWVVLGLTTTAPAVAVATTVLWGWTRLLGW